MAIPTVMEMGQHARERVRSEESHRDTLKTTKQNRQLAAREQSRKETATIADIVQGNRELNIREQQGNRALDLEAQRSAQTHQRGQRELDIRERGQEADIDVAYGDLALKERAQFTDERRASSQLLNDRVNRRMTEQQIEGLQLDNLLQETTNKLEIATAEGKLDMLGEAMAVQRLGLRVKQDELNATREAYTADSIYKMTNPIVQALADGDVELARTLHETLMEKADEYNFGEDDKALLGVPVGQQSIQHWGAINNMYLNTAEHARAMALEKLKSGASDAALLYRMVAGQQDRADEARGNFTASVDDRIQEFGRDLLPALAVASDSKGAPLATNIRGEELDEELSADILTMQSNFTQGAVDWVSNQVGADNPLAPEYLRKTMNALKQATINSFQKAKHEGYAGIFPREKMFQELVPELSARLQALASQSSWHWYVDVEDEVELFVKAIREDEGTQMGLINMASSGKLPTFTQRLQTITRGLSGEDGWKSLDKEALVGLYTTLTQDLFLLEFLRTHGQGNF